MGRLAWLVIALASCVSAQDRSFIQIPDSRKLALVIGNSEYPKAPLKNPVNDASSMEAALKKLGFSVTTLRNADLRHMRTAIDEFAARLGPGSLGFFYFAGHGVQVNSLNYLVPVDFSATSEDDLPYEAYPVNRVQAKLEGSGAKLRVLVLDACRNNPFRFKRDASEGLAAMSINAEGTLVAFATGDNNTAEENPAEANGLYTKFLIPALLSPGLNLRDAFQKAKEDVYRASQHRQNPSIYENKVGEYALIPKVSTSITAVTRESNVDAAVETWAFIKDSQNPEDFEAFVNAFPQSDLARGASIRAAQLRRGTAQLASIPLAPVNPIATSVEDDVSAAKKYYENAQYDLALPLFRRAAEAGNGEGADYLGFLYETGWGVLQKDDEQAVSWYRKSVAAGDPSGMMDLGAMYTRGLGGLPRDDVQAAGLFRKAAEGGNALAMKNLGVMFENGRGGLPRDDTQAMNWYRKAAEGGNANAMVNLGNMYEGGRSGLPKDDEQAANWYRKATNVGNVIGMARLGIMYEGGRGGLPRDDTQAVSWYRKAADGGNSLAMTNLGFMYEYGGGGVAEE